MSTHEKPPLRAVPPVPPAPAPVSNVRLMRSDFGPLRLVPVLGRIS